MRRRILDCETRRYEAVRAWPVGIHLGFHGYESELAWLPVSELRQKEYIKELFTDPSFGDLFV